MENAIVWIVNAIASLILWFADAAFAVVLIVVSILATILGVISGLVWIPFTVLAIILMFGIKSGIAARLLGKQDAPLIYAIQLAFIATALAAVGSFGFLALTMQYGDLRAAFFKAYGVFPEVEKLSAYGSLTEKVYTEQIAPLIRYAKMWGYLLLRDGLFFLAATTVVLYIQLRERGSLGVEIIKGFFFECLVGLLLFAFIIYGGDLLDNLATMGFPAVVGQLIGYIRDECQSAYDLVMIPFGRSRYPTFGSWFHDELVKMSGSIFKMASIYPKFFIVFFLFSLIPYRSTA